MYITNNRITTDRTFSSDMDLLNYVADESILVNENALSFQEAIAEDYVLPRIYAKGTDNKTMNFIEFFESKPNDSNLESMRNILSYRTNTPSWTSSLFEVTLTDELLNRVKKILTHFTGILSDDMEQEVALWNAKTKVENTLATVTLDDIDSITAKESWTYKEYHDLGIFVIQSLGNTPYDLIINDLLTALDSSSSNTI